LQSRLTGVKQDASDCCNRNPCPAQRGFDFENPFTKQQSQFWGSMDFLGGEAIVVADLVEVGR